MTSPGSGIEVALDAMRSDARAWQTAAEQLSGPKSAIGSLSVTVADVSVFAVWAGLDQSYNEAVAAIEEALQNAADYFLKLSSDLNGAASQYERDDEEGMHEIQKTGRIQGDIYGG